MGTLHFLVHWYAIFWDTTWVCYFTKLRMWTLLCMFIFMKVIGTLVHFHESNYPLVEIVHILSFPSYDYHVGLEERLKDHHIGLKAILQLSWTPHVNIKASNIEIMSHLLLICCSTFTSFFYCETSNLMHNNCILKCKFIHSFRYMITNAINCSK